MPAGYLYVLSNLAMPGLLKIGRTDRDPELRARELRTTGVPNPFVLEHHVEVDDSAQAEAQAHQLLQSRGARMSPDREFFAVTLPEAIEALDLVSSLAQALPDFTRAADLGRMAAAISLSHGQDDANLAAQKLARIARRGYPPAMRRVADHFEHASPSGPYFKQYYREYLDLAQAEAKWHPIASSNGRAIRESVGRDAAEYILLCHRHQWLINDDFSFISAFLVRGDRFQYDAYLTELRRCPVPEHVLERACDV